MFSHIGVNPPQSVLISKTRGERFGLTQDIADPLTFLERHEDTAQVKPEIDGLLTHGVTHWQMLEGH